MFDTKVDLQLNNIKCKYTYKHMQSVQCSEHFTMYFTQHNTCFSRITVTYLALITLSFVNHLTEGGL